MDATGISDFPFSSLFLQDLCQKIDPTGSDWLLLFFLFWILCLLLCWLMEFQLSVVWNLLRVDFIVILLLWFWRA